MKNRNKLPDFNDNNTANKPKRLIISGIICLVLLFTIIPRAKTIWELSAQKKELEKEKTHLVQINQQRQEELEKVDSPESMERIAREQLGMVKNGERIIMKVED